MKNIHIIPTDKPSRLHNKNGELGNYPSTKLYIEDFKGNQHNSFHIYITFDEEIKVGDWFLPQGHINPHKLKEYNKINGDLESYNGLCYDISKCKKIILTTDQDLIKDGVQSIDNEFLEWFVKNPSCEEVEIKVDEILNKELPNFTPYHRRSFFLGYNKSQETHPFSEQDMKNFGKFCIENNVCKEENRYYQYWELLQLWKEQKPKIVYYE